MPVMINGFRPIFPFRAVGLVIWFELVDGWCEDIQGAWALSFELRGKQGQGRAGGTGEMSGQ